MVQSVGALDPVAQAGNRAVGAVGWGAHVQEEGVVREQMEVDTDPGAALCPVKPDGRPIAVRGREDLSGPAEVKRMVAADLHQEGEASAVDCGSDAGGL